MVAVVFPELRERVEQLGLEFFDVDLRWGVPAKDANGETANSWEYCRQWIDPFEPFFVCILGQRYGWVREPEQLKARSVRGPMLHRCGGSGPLGRCEAGEVAFLLLVG